MADLVEVAAGVYVLRYPVLDVNATLLVGDGAALVVDTLSTTSQATELAAAVRRVTPYPLTVVNTHHHFDHCLGNAVLAGADAGAIWGHEVAAAYLRERGESLRREAYRTLTAVAPDAAGEIDQVSVRAPDHTVHTESTLDIGGRVAVLRHFGPGHTDGDLVVHVPDADLIVAGDLVEESGPPAFEDSFPVRWPEAVAALLDLTGPASTVVPGHGALVGREFVHGQHTDLTTLAWLIREGHANGSAPEQVAKHSPFGADVSLVAVRRGYAELANRV